MLFYFLLAASLIVGFGMWYVYYGLECFLNGATLRPIKPWLVPFALAWEEFTYAIPGGRKRKGDYIRKIVDRWEGEGVMCSSRGSWDYSEIRKFGLYEKVGAAMLPGLGHFLFMHIAIPFSPAACVILFYCKFVW